VSKHREVAVKVNAFVDEGIADLVVALSEIKGLATLESCQGEPGEADAFVLFRHGDWRQSGAMLFEDLMSALGPELRSQVSLRLEAFENGAAMGSILVEPSAIDDLTAIVRSLTSKNASAGAATEAKPAEAASGSSKLVFQPQSAAASPAASHVDNGQQAPGAAKTVQPGAPRGLPPERVAVGAGS
jgi:hypothetical protein